MIRFDDRVWFLGALWVLTLPLKWLVAAAAAACIHELFHMAAILLQGGKISRIVIKPLGTVMEAEGISGPQEAVCALAGPLGSLLPVLLIHRIPLIGLCALVQGVFNLLPIYPMDGGRVLLRLLEILCPANAERLTKRIGLCVLAVLLAVTVVGAVVFALGYTPVVICAVSILCAAARNRT